MVRELGLRVRELGVKSEGMKNRDVTGHWRCKKTGPVDCWSELSRWMHRRGDSPLAPRLIGPCGLEVHQVSKGRAVWPLGHPAVGHGGPGEWASSGSRSGALPGPVIPLHPGPPTGKANQSENESGNSAENRPSIQAADQAADQPVIQSAIQAEDQAAHHSVHRPSHRPSHQ